MTMTTAAILDRLDELPTEDHTRPHGIDRLVMRLSVTMLIWAQQHAARNAECYEEHTRRHQVRRELHARAHEFARMTARVF